MGFLFLWCGPAVIESLKDSIFQKDTGFSNSYGTPATKCHNSECQSVIAPSGDSNCCIKHSNKCHQCGQYIDGDALFCMDCLTGGVQEKASQADNACRFQYFDGSVCGKNTKNSRLCDEHFKQLDDTYKSLIGE